MGNRCRGPTVRCHAGCGARWSCRAGNSSRRWRWCPARAATATARHAKQPDAASDREKTIAGSRARVVFANTFGTAPISIGAGSIALRDKDSAILPSSVGKLTVNGSGSFKVPAGAIIVSDTVQLSVPARVDLAIDIFVAEDLGTGGSPTTMHNGANQTSYVSPSGDRTGEATLQNGTITRSRFLISLRTTGGRITWPGGWPRRATENSLC